MNEPKIELSDDIIRDVECFADEQIDTVLEHYKGRQQFNIVKMRNDIIVGKLGEFAVYYFLIHSGRECTKPDLTIYPSEEKRFNSDLVSGRLKICVKSQSVEQAGIFGLSWIFQFGGNGNGHRDHILDKKCGDMFTDRLTDMFAGCLVDGNTVYIKTIIPIEIVLDDGVLKDPKMSKYSGIKKALYYKDLKDMDIIMICV